jgi:hypothetical protein
LPDTDALPTFIPPEQSDGGLDCGPNTLKVTVPDGEAPPSRSADADDPEISEPAVPDEGASTDNVGDAATV